MNFGEIIKRADIKSIREYILDGKITNSNRNGSMQKRYDEAIKQTCFYLQERYEEDEADELWENVAELLYMCREVFFETGLRVGIKLGTDCYFDK